MANGPDLMIKDGDLTVYLRGLDKQHAPVLARGMSSGIVRENTGNLGGVTTEFEEDWIRNNAKDPKSIHWAIFLDLKADPIGVTSIHLEEEDSGTTGIVIFDPEQWGRGIASRAHLGRTWFAARYKSRSTLNSRVVEVNDASAKALERVGYMITGRQLRKMYRNGQHLDLYVLTWLHPERIDFLYPEGLPDEYKEGVARATLALEKADKVVSLA